MTHMQFGITLTPTNAWVIINHYVIKPWSVTMWLGIYRNLFMHVHAISGAYNIDQQTVVLFLACMW